jgi:hypothetical protein
MALSDLDKAKEKAPSEAEILREIQRTKRLIAEQDKKDRSLYSRMFTAAAATAAESSEGKAPVGERPLPLLRLDLQ